MDDLLSAYRLGERLHQSARTLVYRGRRIDDGLPVIVKLQNNERPSSAELDSFRREYEIARGLDVEGVIRPLALCQHQNRMALVMADDGSLSLRQFVAQKRLALDAVLELGVQIATALGRIHDRQVVHKDINPANIIIHPEARRIALIDFGIATTLSRESPSFRNPEQLEGMLAYISPEQTGRTNRSVDYRTDLYSLGVTLYELLTGRLPFPGPDPMALIHCHIAVQPTPPHELEPAIPEVVSALVMKLMAKMAEERYQSGAGVAADLEACRTGLHATGRIDAFALGRHDISDRFEIPGKRYGRELESATLCSAFERSVAGRPEVVMIAGYAGMGKSSLVQEIHSSPARSTGYFVSGQFDQLRRNVPYAPLIAAFQELIRQLLAENETQLAGWRSRLQQALGANAAVIAEVIPAVQLILGELPELVPLPAEQARNRFHFTFQHFVRVFSEREHPLTIFLDDLQWADAASLDLVRILVTDTQLRHLCFIGAYRDGELGDEHPLPPVLAAIEEAGLRVTTIPLGPLCQEDVEWMLADTLRCESGRATQLAELLLQRTEGNPFFLHQFLGMLHDERLIGFDSVRRAWRWDIEHIRQRGLVGVVELLTGKLQKLSSRTREVLRLAACIGDRFDLATLAIFTESDLSTTASSFWEALEAGLLLPIDDAYRVASPDRLARSGSDSHAGGASFRFLHGRLRYAAYSLIPEDERPSLHARLGRLLLTHTPPAEREGRLLDIVDQFMLGSACITGDRERYRVARMGLRAGQKAKAAVAFEPACRYLRMGIELLPEAAFEEQHELSFQLHIEAAEAEHLTAHLDRAEELAHVALQHARTLLERARVAENRILFKSSRNQFEETIRIGLDALAELGVHLPIDATGEHFGQALERNRDLLAGRRPEELLDLPEMTDPCHLAAQRMLTHLASPCFVSRPPLFPLVASERFRLSVEHGNSRYAPGGYVLYGALHMRVLGDVEAATAYGDLATRLIDKMGLHEVKAEVNMLNAAFIHSWKRHIGELFEPLRAGIQAGTENGDLYHAFRCGSHLCHVNLVAGTPQIPLLETMTDVVGMLQRHQQAFLVSYVDIMRQWSHNLLGRSADPLVLTGDCFDEDVGLPPLLQAKNYSTTGLFHALKAMLAYIFGDYQAAVAAATRAEADKAALKGLPTSVLVNLYQSLSLLAAHADAGEEERAHSLEVVARNQEELGHWAEHAPMNFLHRYQLVEAEKARALGDPVEAMGLYERAAKNARRQQYLPELAIASERCAGMCRSLGWDRVANMFLGEARYAYNRWGALAKVERMDARTPALLQMGDVGPGTLSRDRTNMTSSTSSGNATLELRSVMEAAEAITGQLVLDELVQSLLRIMVQNAGAQRGLLLLQQEDRLVVRAEWSTDESDVTEREGTLSGDSSLLSSAIVHFAARTGESVVLDNAAEIGQFTKERYIADAGTKSVLCAPLLNQGQLEAVIYMENNLTVGAFTPARLNLLKLLSGQAALAIHNATLYATLEQKVEERTQELRDKNEQLRRTQNQLVTQQKLASLGALAAGIAHELKNPLNFIINFASLSQQLAEELAEELGDVAGSLPEDTREIVDETIGLLGQNTAKIHEQGRRADQIITGMLQHSRQSAGERSATDINAVVAQSMRLASEGTRIHNPGLSVTVRADYDPSVGYIDALAPDLGRVFLNIFNNALYAVIQKRKRVSEDFEPTIDIATRNLGDRVEVRIRDNGTGIPAEVLDRIFMPFFTTKPPGDGTGLGLSISHDIIVGAHQGELDVQTEADRFTEFTMTLPRQPSKAL